MVDGNGRTEPVAGSMSSSAAPRMLFVTLARPTEGKNQHRLPVCRSPHNRQFAPRPAAWLGSWAANSTRPRDAGKMPAQREADMIELGTTDAKFLRIAYAEAKAGFEEGGCPIGSVLAEGDRLIAQGRNQRVQQGDPIAHGEMDCLRKAGRQKSYRRMTLYTSLSPCMMCTGTIIQFGIPRVIIGEATNFAGNPEILRQRGIEVIIADDPDCIALMARFIREKPELWNEDIMED